MAITNLTGGGTQTKTFEEVACSPTLLGGLQQYSIYLSAINIFLSFTAFVGNALILVAVRKEFSLHPPSKLLYRCLATTDICVGLVTHPLSECYLLDVLVTNTRVSLPIRIWRRFQGFHNRL